MEKNDDLLDPKLGEQTASGFKDAYKNRSELLKKSKWEGKIANPDDDKYFKQQLSLNANILRDDLGKTPIEAITYRIVGKWQAVKYKLLGLGRDLGVLFFLIKKRRFVEFYNFAFTRIFVPAGEGSQRVFYQLPFVKKIIAKFPTLVPFPTYIELEPTTVCNKSCIHCEFTYWSPVEQIKKHVTFDEYRHMMDQMPKIRWTNITGEGSAFLNRDYVKMIKYLYKRDKTSIWLVDHLTDMSFEELERDVLPYIHGIYVSIDGGTKETYESIKIGCKWDNLINNLEKLVEYKRRNNTPFPQITFRYVLMNENIHEVPAFIDLINSLGSQKDWGGSSSIIEFTGLLYYPEIAKHYVSEIPDSIISQIKDRVGKGIHFIFAHGEEKSNPPAETCIAWMEPYIMNPGYVMPCCTVMMSNRRPLLRKYSFGNLFESNFQDIWKSGYYQKFKKLLMDPKAPVPKICAGCRCYRTDIRIKKYGIWDVYNDPDVLPPYSPEVTPDMAISLDKVKQSLKDRSSQ